MSNKQRLVLSIIDFLNQSIQDGTVQQDDKESLEVAIQCIGEAFGVDPSDNTQTERLSIKPSTLPHIFDAYLKTHADSGASSASGSAPSAPSLNPSPTDKAAAEKFKTTGNSYMSSKQFDLAIAEYTKALGVDATNPVYYSNRAAAFSSKGDHASAVADAEKAIAADATFVKAYHRLGHAYYSLGNYKQAADAFRSGLQHDPSNVSLKSGLQNAEARVVPGDDEMPPLEAEPSMPLGGAAAGASAGGMAEMLRNLGGGAGAGAGAGGMPDLAGLMNNPMMAQMAQQLMQNGGMERLMQNPMVANMMNRMQSGNAPSLTELMADPSLRELANTLGAGAGAGAGQ